jgi:hypothetical protein
MLFCSTLEVLDFCKGTKSLKFSRNTEEINIDSTAAGKHPDMLALYKNHPAMLVLGEEKVSSIGKAVKDLEDKIGPMSKHFCTIQGEF